MKKVNICMSGGRTSAYLTDQVLNLKSKGFFKDIEFVITFANTSKEHEKTLIFVNNCSSRWVELYGVGVVWLEAVVFDGRKPCGHSVVSFDTALRNGEVFDRVVSKYGLPNSQFLHCTRELKENPIMSYMESLGERKGYICNGKQVNATYETWIGIREDEPKRLKGRRNGKQSKAFPLAEVVDGIDIAADKQDVLDYWAKMPFDLDLPEHLGNCIDCHKKSDKKLEMVYQDCGEKAFRHSAYMDFQYSEVKAQVLEGGTVARKRYRGYRNTKELIASFIVGEHVEGELSSCETSCEPFMDSNEPEKVDFIPSPKTWGELDLMGEDEQII